MKENIKKILKDLNCTVYIFDEDKMIIKVKDKSNLCSSYVSEIVSITSELTIIKQRYIIVNDTDIQLEK